jgi:hypothetical protein
MIKQDVKKKKKPKLNSNGQLYIQLEQHWQYSQINVDEIFN